MRNFSITIQILTGIAAILLCLSGCHCTDQSRLTRESEQPPSDTNPRIDTPLPAETIPLPQDNRPLEKILNELLSNRIYFDFDKWALTTIAQQRLTHVGDKLKRSVSETPIHLTIEGHTDEVGTEEYNLALGEKRAQMVVEYLVQYGVPRERFSLISYGEEKPARHTSGSNDKNAQNRRAQFTVHQQKE